MIGVFYDKMLYLLLLLFQLSWASWNLQNMCVMPQSVPSSHRRSHHGVRLPRSRLAVSKQTHVVALRGSRQHRHTQVLEHLRSTNTHTQTHTLDNKYKG